MKYAPFLLAALMLVGGPGRADSFRVETVASNLSRPWSVAFLPADGMRADMLITELGGQLRRVGADGSIGEPIAGVPPVYFAGQGGLFDVTLHPRFRSNGVIYLSYAEGGKTDNGTAIARARLVGDRLEDVERIFRVSPSKDTPAHYGGRMAFLSDGTLLLTTGDGFTYREAAQDVDSGLGKTMRMNDDGTPAAGNPFPESPYVYSYGHRSPQGLAVARDGTIWQHEHGARGGDEVNRIEAGKNYGWPAITHGIDYSGARISPYSEWPGMEQPVVHWTPSIAPSGLAIYEAGLFPQWRGDLFVGALAGQHLRRVDLENGQAVGQESLLEDRGQRIRDVRVGPDGALYVLTDGEGGELLRLVPDRP